MPPGVAVRTNYQLDYSVAFRSRPNEIRHRDDEKVLSLNRRFGAHRQLALRNGHRLRLAVLWLDNLNRQMAIVRIDVRGAGKRHRRRKSDVNYASIFVDADQLQSRIDDDSGRKNGAHRRRPAHHGHWNVRFIQDNLYLAHQLKTNIWNRAIQFFLKNGN